MLVHLNLWMFRGRASCAQDAVRVTLSGFTLSAARPAFTYGIVAEGGTGPAGTVTLRIDVAWYSFAPEYDWTRRASCMHQVDPRTP